MSYICGSAIGFICGAVKAISDQQFLRINTFRAAVLLWRRAVSARQPERTTRRFRAIERPMERATTHRLNSCGTRRHEGL